MRKYLYGLLVSSLLIISCKTSSPILGDVQYGVSMYNAFEQVYTVQQFDSICNADKISNDLSTWKQLSFKDGETNNVVTEYMFIKSNSCIYRLIKKSDTTYKITKRITK